MFKGMQMNYKDFETLIAGEKIIYYPAAGSDLGRLVDLHFNTGSARLINQNDLKLRSTFHNEGAVPVLVDITYGIGGSSGFEFKPGMIVKHSTPDLTVTLKNIEPISDCPDRKELESRGYLNGLYTIAGISSSDYASLHGYLTKSITLNPSFRGDKLDLEIRLQQSRSTELISFYYFNATDALFLMELKRMQAKLTGIIHFSYPGFGCPPPDPIAVLYFNKLIYPIGIPDWVWTSQFRQWPTFFNFAQAEELGPIVQFPISADKEVFDREVKRIEKIGNYEFLLLKWFRNPDEIEDKLQFTYSSGFNIIPCPFIFFELFQKNRNNLITFNRQLPAFFTEYFGVDADMVQNSSVYEYTQSNGFHFLHLPSNASVTEQFKKINKIKAQHKLKMTIATDFMIRQSGNDFNLAERIVRAIKATGHEDFTIVLNENRPQLIESAKSQFRELCASN